MDTTTTPAATSTLGGADAAGLKPWLIEPVAGIVEPGETPEGVARREALEEAGCEIAELEPIGTVSSTPGGCSEVLHLYCGRVDTRRRRRPPRARARHGAAQRCETTPPGGGVVPNPICEPNDADLIKPS